MICLIDSLIDTRGDVLILQPQLVVYFYQIGLKFKNWFLRKDDDAFGEVVLGVGTMKGAKGRK